MRGVRLLLLALWLFGSSLSLAAAEEVSKSQQFVYGINAFTWQDYAGALAPRTVRTIYLLAGQPSILSPRETLVYYWPITGEYRADWEALNRSVPGALELLVPGMSVRTLPRVQYVIQYPQGPGRGQPLLYMGKEAMARYEAFRNARAQYRDELARYQEQRRLYIEALDRAVRARHRGEQIEIPQPPQEPAPFQLFSSEVHDGFAVQLPPGRYRIRLRQQDGRILAESERTLVVITHRRESIGFTIVPQQRWTVPERADDPESTIYARRGQVIYLQPFLAREYNDLAFTRLLNPQSREGRPDWWRWEYVRPLDAERLEVLAGGSAAQMISRRLFRVVQTPGEALGYQVVEPSGAQPPDFEGFKVAITAPTLRVRLLDERGHPLPGGARTIQVPRTQAAWPMALVLLLPLTVGAMLVSMRRERSGRSVGSVAG